MLVYKRGLLGYFKSTSINDFEWGDDIKSEIRDVLSLDAIAFRNKCGYVFASDFLKVDLSWRATLPKSADSFLTLVEETIYSTKHDTEVRKALVNRRDHGSLLGQEHFSDLLGVIKDMFDAENHGSDKTVDEKDDEDIVDVVIGAAGMDAAPEVKKIDEAAAGKEDVKAKLESFKTQARRTISTFVTLSVESDTDDAIIKSMTESGVAKVKNIGSGMIGVLYDSKLGGESSATPHIRHPSLRDNGEHLKRFASLKLRAGGDETSLPDDELWMLPDAGKHGNKNTLLSCLKNVSIRKETELTVVYDQESMEARLERLRGYIPLNQTERIHLISAELPRTPEIRRKHFNGSNKGNVLGMVALPKYDDPQTWRLPIKTKREVIGKTGGKVLVGGPPPGLSAEQLAALKALEAATASEKANPSRLEPVFYHGWPRALCEELQHSYDLRGMYHLTAGGPEMAMVFLRARRPYYGICLSEEHRKALITKLEVSVFTAMRSEDDPLHEPALTALIKDNLEGQEDDGDEKPKPLPKPKGKNKKKKAREAFNHSTSRSLILRPSTDTVFGRRCGPLIHTRGRRVVRREVHCLKVFARRGAPRIRIPTRMRPPTASARRRRRRTMRSAARSAPRPRLACPRKRSWRGFANSKEMAIIRWVSLRMRRKRSPTMARAARAQVEPDF